ncbi:MAG: N-formylglutamate amidohydrolase [Planctomycetes bacterium]|nr:N-formylglutamate amidohydrolase [Planctomycetota bacterium]
MTSDSWRSIPDVCEFALIRGGACLGEPTLLLEVPHGATRAEDYDALREALSGDYPDDLRDFFFVNTDVGAPELALSTALALVTADPTRCVAVLRCLVPRTFVDCNRVIDAAPRPRGSAAGEMTPGVHAWVKHAGDLALLLARYRAYRELAESLYEGICGNGGRALMLHSYAPRSIDVAVDENIVASLRDAYRPEKIGTWELRAEVDLIADDPEGQPLASEALVREVRRELEAVDLGVARCGTYALHPSTLAHVFATQHPGQTLCVEFRRDLLVEEFTPFAQMRADPRKLERIALPLARAVSAASA